jgi:hypothetical protein
MVQIGERSPTIKTGAPGILSEEYNSQVDLRSRDTLRSRKLTEPIVNPHCVTRNIMTNDQLRNIQEANSIGIVPSDEDDAQFDAQITYLMQRAIHLLDAKQFVVCQRLLDVTFRSGLTASSNNIEDLIVGFGTGDNRFFFGRNTMRKCLRALVKMHFIEETKIKGSSSMLHISPIVPRHFSFSSTPTGF